MGAGNARAVIPLDRSLRCGRLRWRLSSLRCKLGAWRIHRVRRLRRSLRVGRSLIATLIVDRVFLICEKIPISDEKKGFWRWNCDPLRAMVHLCRWR